MVVLGFGRWRRTLVAPPTRAKQAPGRYLWRAVYQEILRLSFSVLPELIELIQGLYETLSAHH